MSKTTKEWLKLIMEGRFQPIASEIPGSGSFDKSIGGLSGNQDAAIHNTFDMIHPLCPFKSPVSWFIQSPVVNFSGRRQKWRVLRKTVTPVSKRIRFLFFHTPIL